MISVGSTEVMFQRICWKARYQTLVNEGREDLAGGVVLLVGYTDLYGGTAGGSLYGSEKIRGG